MSAPSFLAVSQLDGITEKPVTAHAPNLKTLIRAAKHGDLCLMECALNATGEKVAAVCAMSLDQGEYVMTPLAIMLNGNPYELLTPPNANKEGK